MKRLLVLALLVSLLTGCLAAPNAPAPKPTRTPRAFLTITPLNDVQVLNKTKRPNFLFILTDDLDQVLGTLQYMPHLQDLLVTQGMTFNDFFISHTLCCPSRSTFLRGQYTHNHHVYRNELPNGGFGQAYYLENEASTIGTWLQAAGYRTVLLGKYLNAYPFPDDRTYVPVGWNEWYVGAKGSPYPGYHYSLNENGKLVDYEVTGQSGPSQYMTDVLSNKTADFIQRASADGVPFFVYLSTYAPHSPAKPAPRHANLFPDLIAPRTPSFNEADVSDKPDWIKFDPLLDADQIANIDAEYRDRVRSMQAVDESIAQLVDVLKSTGQLDNTYIIFTSDNGYHLGQHRLSDGKGSPYEEDIHVPFIIRGPGIAAGSTLDGYLTGNVDFAPTVAELAGVTPPDYVDGRSLVPLFGTNKPASGDWRSAYLLEFYGYNPPGTDLNSPAPDPQFLGIRMQDSVYIEYQGGFVEYYDLKNDPYELENIASTTDKTLLAHFSDWLHQLAACAGSQCRKIESNAAP